MHVIVLELALEVWVAHAIRALAVRPNFRSSARDPSSWKSASCRWSWTVLTDTMLQGRSFGLDEIQFEEGGDEEEEKNVDLLVEGEGGKPQLAPASEPCAPPLEHVD